MSTYFDDENVIRLAEAAKANKVPSLKVNDLLGDQHDKARSALTTKVEIIDTTRFPSVAQLYSEVPKWYRMQNVVAVSADLKSSTALSFDKYVNTSARLYEAVTSSSVRLMAKFNPEFIDIQGDGVFALFHGERAFERALCAGVTLKTFSSRSLEPMIGELFAAGFPETGLKIGIASGVLVAKKVGIRGTNEPVWAGKPVNYAVKCGGKADRHELIVTSNVYDKLTDNQYVTHSCGCGSTAGPVELWSDTEVEKLGKHSSCRLLKTSWCSVHGDEFCDAILQGKKDRDDVQRRAA